jgi:hypothetical protein
MSVFEKENWEEIWTQGCTNAAYERRISKDEKINVEK